MMLLGLALLVCLLVCLGTGLAYVRAPLWSWTVVGGALLAVLTAIGAAGVVTLTVLWILFAGLALLFNLRPLRRGLITRHILRVFRRLLPRMSDTEREAIDAGTVWWDGELFSGRPDWQRLLSAPPPRLSDEEQGTCRRKCGSSSRTTDSSA
jgi:acyl-CoA dehydrogenase